MKYFDKICFVWKPRVFVISEHYKILAFMLLSVRPLTVCSRDGILDTLLPAIAYLSIPCMSVFASVEAGFDSGVILYIICINSNLFSSLKSGDKKKRYFMHMIKVSYFFFIVGQCVRHNNIPRKVPYLSFYRVYGFIYCNFHPGIWVAFYSQMPDQQTL